MRLLSNAIVILVLGSGCAVQRANVATRAQQEMVGMSKRDLLLCAGVPARQDRVDELEFLTYTGGGDSTTAAYAPPGSNIAVGKRHQRYCEATFVLNLKEGVVQEVRYQGRTGGLVTQGEQCAFIVENCVRR